jgi:hypothetical protein
MCHLRPTLRSRILLVESNAIVGLDLAEELEACGYQVSGPFTDATVLDRLKGSTPDLYCGRGSPDGGFGGLGPRATCSWCADTNLLLLRPEACAPGIQDPALAVDARVLGSPACCFRPSRAQAGKDRRAGDGLTSQPRDKGGGAPRVRSSKAA